MSSTQIGYKYFTLEDKSLGLSVKIVYTGLKTNCYVVLKDIVSYLDYNATFYVQKYFTNGKRIKLNNKNYYIVPYGDLATWLINLRGKRSSKALVLLDKIRETVLEVLPDCNEVKASLAYNTLRYEVSTILVDGFSLRLLSRLNEIFVDIKTVGIFVNLYRKQGVTRENSSLLNYESDLRQRIVSGYDGQKYDVVAVRDLIDWFVQRKTSLTGSTRLVSALEKHCQECQSFSSFSAGNGNNGSAIDMTTMRVLVKDVINASERLHSFLINNSILQGEENQNDTGFEKSGVGKAE